jgi:hypothetical protein
VDDVAGVLSNLNGVAVALDPQADALIFTQVQVGKGLDYTVLIDGFYSHCTHLLARFPGRLPAF